MTISSKEQKNIVIIVLAYYCVIICQPYYEFDTLFLGSLSLSNNYILYINNAGLFKPCLYATAHS